MKDLRQLLETAKTAALEAGEAVMEIYHSGKFDTTMKPGDSPVTKADQAAHAIITRRLAHTGLPVLSEEGIHIEYNERKQWEYCWLVDPLDGTKEFINKNGEFTINIALVHQHAPVAGIIYVPVTGTLYIGSKENGVFKYEKGKRVTLSVPAKRRQMQELLHSRHVTVVASRSHSSGDTRTFIDRFQNVTLISLGSSLKFMLLLENRADIYPRLGTTMEWDTAAAHAILNAANRGVYREDLQSELSYNKPELANPFFIAF